jgi:polyhydroxyalkanoate synthesis regulator phasin
MNTAVLVIGIAALLGGQGAQRQPAAAADQAESRQRGDAARLREAIESLTKEVGLLRASLALRDIADEFTIGQLRLMLLDERIARLQREQSDLRGRTADAAAAEEALQRRLGDIDTELILYGGLNREDSRRAITASLTEQLNKAREDQQRLRTRWQAISNEILSAQREAEVLRSHLLDLSKRLAKARPALDAEGRPAASPQYVPGVEQRRTETNQPPEDDTPE